MKAQTVRLFDVLVIGPIMLWGGWKLMREHPLRGQFLAVSGLGTIAYNGYNYLRISRGHALPGGHADRVKYSTFDPQQLRVGTAVEMEHTNDPAIAREIASDHLVEDPLYYVKLRRAGL